MTPEQEIDDLDRFIDMLQSGVASNIDAGTESGLAELANTVLELQRRAEPVWPDDNYPARASAHIAEVLRTRTARYEPSSAGPIPLNGLPPALPDDPKPIEPRASHHLTRWLKDIGQMAAVALVLVLVAGLLVMLIGNVDGSRFGRATSQPTGESPSLGQIGVPANCPVTTEPSPPFTPPAPYASTPYPDLPGNDDFWYGSPQLWTFLQGDGSLTALHDASDYTFRMLWFSQNYNFAQAQTAQTQPSITFTGARLDGPAAPLNATTSNAFSGEFRSSMIAGFSVSTPGCWKITGDFEGNMLSVVIWVTRQTPGTPTSLPGTASDGGEIAFTSKRSGTYQIYAVKADGSGLHQLTNGPEDNLAPSWSPDGTKIAFFRTNGIPDASPPPLPIGADASGRVYVMNADGSDLHSLTPNGSRDYESLSWSPDGTQLAVQCDGGVQICVYLVDGAGVRRVLPPDLFGGGITWSPDGRWIAFIGEQSSAHIGGIYLVSPDGAQLRAVKQDNDHESSISWSPNGNQIVYIHGMEQNKLTVINIDGSDVHDLDIGDRFPSAVRWSPDGSMLLFLTGSAPGSPGGLAVINADGTGLRDILPISDTGDHNVYTAIWSPDSQAIAVTRGAVSHSLATPEALALGAELDVVQLEGSPARTLFKETAISPADGWPASWQPLATTPGT